MIFAAPTIPDAGKTPDYSEAAFGTVGEFIPPNYFDLKKSM
jgi:hypothetical protein